MDLLLLIQVLVAEAGLILYGASFFGYGWDDGWQFAMAALFCGFLASIPTVIRDRKFFLKYWGFGLSGIRRHFPLQFFPARQIEWLNPLGWCFMGILLLHFFWLVVRPATAQSARADTGADLRYLSLMVTFGGVLGALTRAYPPTEKSKTDVQTDTLTEAHSRQ